MPVNGKRKIIIIGPAYPYRGGPSTFVSYIYKSINHLFDVKIFNYKLLYPSFLFPGTTQYDRSTEKKLIVPSERLVNSINPFNWIKTAIRINRENADLVIFDWWHPFFGPCHYTISLLIKKQYRRRILFITENYISHEQNSIDKILTRVGLSNAGAFLALSSTVDSDLKINFPRSTVYRSELPSFDVYAEAKTFDRKESRSRLGLNQDDKVLLFFGYVRKYKGLDLLLESIPLVLKKLPDIKLLIAGEFYDNIEYYQGIITRTGIKENVILINKFVANEDVGIYYSSADLNVLPYRSATQSAVLNVSYSFRKPVVATDVGGLSEFINNGETGIIVRELTPQALSEGIIEFFNLKDKIDFVGNIEKLSRQSEFNKFPQLLERICKELE